MSQLSDELRKSLRGQSWLKHLPTELIQILDDVGTKLAPLWNANLCQPGRDTVLAPFHMIATDEVKLVLICKEPYRGGMATGIPIEPSNGMETKSRSYFSRFVEKYWNGINSKNFMTCYYASGILVLNASFTVDPHCDRRYKLSASHFPLWTRFMKPFTQFLLSNNVPIVLLGSEAKSLCRNLETKGLTSSAGFPTDEAGYASFSDCMTVAVNHYIYKRDTG